MASPIRVPVATLSGHNVVSTPFPASCPKARVALAHATRSQTASKSASKSAPIQVTTTTQNSALAELAFQTKASPQICQDLQRTPAEPELSPLVAAVIGSKNPSAHQTF